MGYVVWHARGVREGKEDFNLDCVPVGWGFSCILNGGGELV